MDGFGGDVNPPTSSGDVNFIYDFICVERNVCNDIRPTFSLTLLSGGNLVRNRSVRTIAPISGKRNKYHLFLSEKGSPGLSSRYHHRNDLVAQCRGEKGVCAPSVVEREEWLT